MKETYFNSLKDQAKKSAKFFVSKGLVTESTTSTLELLNPDLPFSDLLYRMYSGSLSSAFADVTPITSPTGTIPFFYCEGETDNTGVNIAIDIDNLHTKMSKASKDETVRDELSTLPNKKFYVKGLKVDAKLHRVKSVWSQEAVQDFKSMFVSDLLNESIAADIMMEIYEEIDRELLSILDAKSTKSQVAYKNSEEVLQAILNVGIDSCGVLSCLPNLVCICSRDIAAVLGTNVNFVPFSSLEQVDNAYLFGKIGSLTILVDLFGIGKELNNKDSYAYVGVKNYFTMQRNSSMLYFPYITTFVSELDPKAGNILFVSNVRYDLKQNPLDNPADNSSNLLKRIDFTKA